MKEIKEKAQNDDPRNIAMFMPGKVKELQTIDRKDKYSEQLDMLKCDSEMRRNRSGAIRTGKWKSVRD